MQGQGELFFTLTTLFYSFVTGNEVSLKDGIWHFKLKSVTFKVKAFSHYKLYINVFSLWHSGTVLRQERSGKLKKTQSVLHFWRLCFYSQTPPKYWLEPPHLPSPAFHRPSSMYAKWGYLECLSRSALLVCRMSVRNDCKVITDHTEN